MSTINQKQQPFQPRIRFVRLGLLLLTLGAIVMILNALSIVPLPNTLSNALSITFATSGVIISFGHWLLPPPATTATPLNDHPQQHSSGAIATRDLEALRQQVENTLDKQLRKGALIAATSEHQIPYEIRLIPLSVWADSPYACDQLKETRKKIAERHPINAGYVCAVIYRNLDPGDYKIWSDVHHPTSVRVSSNKGTGIDLR